MAAANGETIYKGREKPLKNEGDNLSSSSAKSQPRHPIPVPKTSDPPHQLSMSESNELSSPLTAPNSNSDGNEPSVKYLSDALQMTDIGNSEDEVEGLLEQALDLNRRLKAELANRIALGDPTLEFPVDLGLDGQHSFACRETRKSIPVLPPLARPQHDRVGGSTANRRHKQPQDHKPMPVAHKVNKA